LNAAGRLDTAELALALFEEREENRARAIARELTLRNAQRQSIERRVVGEVRARIARSFRPEREAVLIEASPGWHRGVLGIAASRLAREYHRPVLLFALEGDRAIGSGRSIPGVSLHELLKDLSPLLQEFGGHEQAVGASLRAQRFSEFQASARAHFAQRIPAQCLERIEEAEAHLPLEQVDQDLARLLDRFEPHGMGNPRPIFSTTAAPARPFQPLGESGVRGRLVSGRGELDCLCWRRESVEGLAPGETMEMHYRLGRNRMGRIEAEIVSVRRSERDSAGHAYTVPSPRVEASTAPPAQPE
jgi:single-stranded-DNA-specific exonuclease